MATVTTQKAPSYQEVRQALDIVARNDPETAEEMKAALNGASDVDYPAIAREVVDIGGEWREIEIKEATKIEVKAEPKRERIAVTETKVSQRQRREAWSPPKTHIWTADQLAKQEPLLYRFIAITLWVLSLIGTILGFVGGWDDVTWDTPFLIGMGVAVGWQIVVTYVQVVTCRSLRNPIYWLALAASVIPAYIGYRPLILVPLSEWLTGDTGDVFASLSALQLASQDAILGALAVSVAGVIVLAAFDIIPERVFVKH